MSKKPWITWLTAVLLALLPASIVPAVDDTDIPATEDDPLEHAQEFGETIAAFLNDRDSDQLRATFHVDLLLQRARTGLTVGNDFWAGFSDSFGKGFTAGKRLCAMLGEPGWAESIRVRASDDGSHKILVRLALSAVVFDYLEFRVERNAQGTLGISDVYYQSDGQFHSTRLRPIIAQAHASALDTGTVDWIQHMQALTQFERSGEHERALEALGRLPENVQSSKHMLLKRVLLARRAGLPEIEKAGYVAFEKKFPNDPAIAISKYDSLVVAQKYKEAIPFLRQVRENIGGDPYLHYSEGTLLRVTGDAEAAKKALRRCIEGDPLLIGPYEQLITISLAEKDYDATTSLLATLQDDLEVELADIEAMPAYAEYVASPQYKNWKESRADPVTEESADDSQQDP